MILRYPVLLYLSDLVATSRDTHELGGRIGQFAYFLLDNSWDLRLGKGQTLLVQRLDSQVKTAFSQSWLYLLFWREIGSSNCDAYFSILTNVANSLLWRDSPTSLQKSFKNYWNKKMNNGYNKVFFNK